MAALFGRILVRVRLTEPRPDVEVLPFQRVYPPEKPLRHIAHEAWLHFAGRDPSLHWNAALCVGQQTLVCVSSSDATSLGDYLNMRADDQTTLGTVQFELRCSLMEAEVR